VLADPGHVEDAQATTAIHTAIALGVEKLDSTPLVRLPTAKKRDNLKNAPIALASERRPV
jgi:hypothetical protein